MSGGMGEVLGCPIMAIHLGAIPSARWESQLLSGVFLRGCHFPKRSSGLAQIDRPAAVCTHPQLRNTPHKIEQVV